MAGSVLDPERLLWVPGRKTYFVMPPVPPVLSVDGLSIQFIREFEMSKPSLSRFDALFGWSDVAATVSGTMYQVVS